MRRALLIAALLATAPAYGAGLLTCYDGSTAQDHCDWKTAETPQQQGIGPSAPWNRMRHCDEGWPGICDTAPSPPDTSWHLLTQSYGGTVSLVKGLTERECGTALAKVMASQHVICPDRTSCPVDNGPSTIRTAECFQ